MEHVSIVGRGRPLGAPGKTKLHRFRRHCYRCYYARTEFRCKKMSRRGRVAREHDQSPSIWRGSYQAQGFRIEGRGEGQVVLSW